MSGVLDKSFDVLLPELGIIKRVYCQVNMSPFTCTTPLLLITESVAS